MSNVQYIVGQLYFSKFKKKFKNFLSGSKVKENTDGQNLYFGVFFVLKTLSNY